MAAMQRRRLGRTGHESSIAILGGAAFWTGTPEDARTGLDLALERGLNHLDIAPQYGAAESLVGPLIPAVRDRLFVAGKTLRANPDGVRAQFDDTRRLLGTDVLDLYQAHAVTSLEELDRRGKAIETIIALRDSGAARFAGITGHDMTVPGTFLEALRRYDLDTVMFPVYPRVWGDAAYREDAERLLGVCAERDLGVMAIKAVARRPWSAPPSERPPSPWYEPWTEPADLARGVSFTLSTPGVHAFCTPGDRGLLPAVLDAAEAFEPMDEVARGAAILEMSTESVIFPIPR
jgi:aryl-alcohol dehydrogenase-like predicted oxidoreductase